MAGAESYRGAQEDPEKRKYPGGAFDPMGALCLICGMIGHDDALLMHCCRGVCLNGQHSEKHSS